MKHNPSHGIKKGEMRNNYGEHKRHIRNHRRTIKDELQHRNRLGTVYRYLLGLVCGWGGRGFIPVLPERYCLISNSDPEKMVMNWDTTFPTRLQVRLSRLRSADQSRRCPLEEVTDTWLPLKSHAKTMAMLRGCAGSSEYSMGAHVTLKEILWSGWNAIYTYYFNFRIQLCSRALAHIKIIV